MAKLDKDTVNKIKQFGFYSKGLVYALMGILAAMVAFGVGGDIKGKSGIVQFLHGLPGGKILTAVVALGLLAYTLWRVYQAIFDPGNKKTKKRIGPRLQYAYSGVFYAVIALSFAQPILNGKSSSDDSSKKAMLSNLLDKEWGIWAVWVIAIAMAGNAIWQCYLGYSGKYMKQIDEQPENKHEYTLVKRSGRYGYIARGFVFGIISFFVFKVSLAHNASAYKDTEGALQYLLSISYGPILMGAVALGMLGYGIFCFMVARHFDLTKVS